MFVKITEKNKLDFFKARDEEHPRNISYEGEEFFDGMVKKRRPTDFLFLVLFILINGALAGYITYGFQANKIYRLYKGNDFRADTCGELHLISKPYLFYHDPEGQGVIGMCVDRCPSESDQDICFYDNFNKGIMDDYCYITYITSPVNYYCMPLVMNKNRTIIESHLKSPRMIVTKLVGDMYLIKDIMAIAMGITLFSGIIFYAMMLINKKTITVMLVVAILGIGGCVGFMSFLLITERENYIKLYCLKGIEENGCEGIWPTFLFALRWIIIGLAFIYYLILIKYRRRVLKVIGMVDTLKKPLIMFKSIVLTYIISVLSQIAFLWLLLEIVVTIISSGKSETLQAPYKFPAPYFRLTIQQEWYHYFLIFVYIDGFWWLMITRDLNKFITSASSSLWYFSKEKSHFHLPIVRSLKTGIVYHLGSIIKGSFILSWIWPFRFITNSLKNRLDKSEKDSKLFKICLISWSCCLSLHESYTKYLRSRNYIQMAIYGESFMVAGQRLYYLRYRNTSRIQNLKNYLGFVTNIGQLFLSLLPATFSYYYILNFDQTFMEKDIKGLNYPIFIPFILFYVSLFIAQVFSSPFDVMIETIFYCFCADEEMYLGRQRYAEQFIKDFMDNFGKESDYRKDDPRNKVNPFAEDYDEEVVMIAPKIDDGPKTRKRYENNEFNEVFSGGGRGSQSTVANDGASQKGNNSNNTSAVNFFDNGKNSKVQGYQQLNDQNNEKRGSESLDNIFTANKSNPNGKGITIANNESIVEKENEDDDDDEDEDDEEGDEDEEEEEEEEQPVPKSKKKDDETDFMKDFGANINLNDVQKKNLYKDYNKQVF